MNALDKATHPADALDGLRPGGPVKDAADNGTDSILPHACNCTNVLRHFRDAPDVLGLKHVSELLGVSHETARLMCRDNVIPAVKPTGCNRWFIPKDGLVAWLHGEETGAQDE